MHSKNELRQMAHKKVKEELNNPNNKCEHCGKKTDNKIADIISVCESCNEFYNYDEMM